MRNTAKSSFLICDLAGDGLRQALPGAIKIAPRLSAAVLIDAARSIGHRRLAEAIKLGEFAQSVRSAEGLARAAEIILSLPLGKAASYIGRYYHALCLNRQGRQAFPEANETLIEVADDGPRLFRGKARVALATNLRIAGDNRTAVELYGEAARIAGSCQHGKLHPLFMAAYHCASVKDDEGDYRGALADLRELEPLARQVGLTSPAVLDNYYNSLAVFLTANGNLEEALHVRERLLASPFLGIFPEWQNTCADIAHKTRPRRRSFVSMSVAKPFTGDPAASTKPARRETSSCTEIVVFLLVINVISRQLRRVSVRLFSGLPVSRLLLAAREAALSRRRARGQVRPYRWSYTRVYPAYRRPPNL